MFAGVHKKPPPARAAVRTPGTGGRLAASLGKGGTMARLVRRTPQQPTKYVIDGKDQWFCKCGLSKNQPYCDGSHKITQGEDPNKLYWYDDAGKRHELAGDFPGIRSY
jgi:CDGSH-type Zn-finger protein